MSQRAIEIVVGRLVTDERFREAFLSSPRQVLEDLVAEGMALTETEMRSLVATRASLWSEVGEQVHPNLQKASLT
jgi:hypothetical protein